MLFALLKLSIVITKISVNDDVEKLLTLFICCLLCCTVLIPYVGTVILLPIYVFWRSYSVHFLGQFNDNLKMFEGGQTAYITLNPGEAC